MTEMDPALPADRLIVQGNELVAEVARLRASVDRQAKLQSRGLVAAVGIIVLLSAVMLDNRAGLAALQDKLCPLVTVSIPAPGEAPPSTRHGVDVVRASKALADDWSCPTR